MALTEISPETESLLACYEELMSVCDVQTEDGRTAGLLMLCNMANAVKQLRARPDVSFTHMHSQSGIDGRQAQPVVMWLREGCVRLRRCPEMTDLETEAAWQAYLAETCDNVLDNWDMKRDSELVADLCRRGHKEVSDHMVGRSLVA